MRNAVSAGKVTSYWVADIAAATQYKFKSGP